MGKPKFTDKVIWITGASTGIGAALALALSREGARLILSARNTGKLEAVKDGCQNDSGPPRVLPLDLADLDSLEEKAETALGFYGHLDILVNNAGVGQRALAVETRREDARRLVDTNLLGPITLTQAILPAMIARRSGHLVVTSSILGKFGIGRRAVYCATKHALHGYFDSLRAENHEHNIKVTLICPGYIRTDLPLTAINADGAAHGVMDAGQLNGMSAEACAAKMVQAIYRQRQEVLIGGPEILAVQVKRFFPRIFSWIARRVKMA